MLHARHAAHARLGPSAFTRVPSTIVSHVWTRALGAPILATTSTAVLAIRSSSTSTHQSLITYYSLCHISYYSYVYNCQICLRRRWSTSRQSPVSGGIVPTQCCYLSTHLSVHMSTHLSIHVSIHRYGLGSRYFSECPNSDACIGGAAYMMPRTDWGNSSAGEIAKLRAAAIKDNMATGHTISVMTYLL